MATPNQGDMFDAYFRRADLDRDGRISGAEAVAFFQGSNLPKQVLAQIWTYADQNRTGYLGRAEFYNALKLVTVAQSKRELTPEIVRVALYGPASAKIPAPQINLPSTAAPQPGAAGAALPASQAGTGTPAVSQNSGFRGASVNQTTNMNHLYGQSSASGLVRPPTAVPGVSARPMQGVGFQGFPGGAPPMVQNMPTAGVANNAGGANAVGASTGMLSDRGNGHLTNHTGLPSATPGPVTSLPTNQPVASTVISSVSSIVQPKQQASQNGVASGSGFGGEAFSATASQLKRDGLFSVSSGGIVPPSSALVPVSASTQPLSVHGSLDSVPNSLNAQPVGGQLQKTHAFLKQNQQVPVQSISQSGSPAIPPHSSPGHQLQLQWPRPTQTDVQKYTKLFMEVDTDKDGKITGEQARNLFLGWGLPREVLKQVWDLSDQDNDSMLSLREFCVALYLMERHREGRPLPAALPSNIFLDFPATSQPTTAGYRNVAWGPQPGLRQPQGMPGGGARPTGRPPGKPPLPVPSVSADDRLPPKPQRAKVPVLEKPLVDQLSEEEQKSLNLKFQEASDANKKVEELEKDIKEAREKTEFYRVKMQELVIYKSRCDSRLNEVTERAAADKREVEALAKKYEEKYRQAGDVASKLTIEEATFRDIQEKKMEMYQAIVKMEQDGSDENLEARADRIQSSLEDLVKSLSERCKKYGLRAKPTTLLELPFGWQPGIQAGAADWTEDWDKLDDEGFAFVKELTLDVQNVVAPPKTKLKLPKKEKSSAIEGELAAHTSDVESKPSKLGPESGEVVENGVMGSQKDGTVRSPHGSPSARSFQESPRDGSKDNHFDKSLSSNASPRAEKTHSDLGVEDASFSGGKSFDGSAWGTFDANDDVDSAWGPSKEVERDRHNDDLFGHGGWTLPPIKTGSSQTDTFLPKKSIFDDSVPSTPAEGFLPKKSIFADSVPGTPADGFLPKKSIFADSVPGTPADGFLPKKSVFADSVPSTPLFSSSYSPKKYGEGTSESGFNFSRFDSFRSTDSGFQPQKRLTRFDSIGSTRDFDAQDVGSFQPREAFQRFDSMRSTHDFDYGHQSSSFDDSDPFGSGPFRSSFGYETPRGGSDAFGSGGHFRSSLGSETPRSEVDPFRSVGPFGSSMASETPRADPDPFGSDGPFRSTWGHETPRRDEDPFGSAAPFSSLGGETPRRESDYFAHSSSFRSSFGSETPRRDFDSFGFGGPFGSSSVGSETPRRDSDQFGASGSFNYPVSAETPRRDSDQFGTSGSFKYSMSGETPRGGTDSWRAF